MKYHITRIGNVYVTPPAGVPDGCSPVVVISPEDREQVERLSDLMPPCESPATCGQPVRCMGTRLREALREFANPTPRIEEPKGLGAVIEDDKGYRHVRGPRVDRVWFGSDGKHRDWLELNPTRVLSEGYSEVEGVQP